MVAACCIFGASSYAVIIDFQSLEAAGYPDHGTQYIEDGYQLDCSSEWGFWSLGTNHTSYSGSTALHVGDVVGNTQLSKVGGGTFDLISIDLAELYDLGSYDVTFVRDGGHSQTFTLDGIAFGAETFTFDSGFLGSTTVTWAQDPEYHQFDDIVIIPEPASIGLLGLISGGIYFARRFFVV